MITRKHILSALYISIFILFNPSDILAAGMGMGGGTPCGGIFPPCPVPLNNGVILLLIAGAAYGGYKLYNVFKKNPA
jgi:hypothetical protein